MRIAEFKSLSPHGFHRVVYREWGAPDNPEVVVCVHGLTRNSLDFESLAQALAASHRVIAVDMPGRGASERLADPMDYQLPTYLTVLTALIARTGAPAVDWVGTSMGGLHGIVLAAQPGSPIRRLVLNDIGPAIEPAALIRITGYVGTDPTFASYEEMLAHHRSIAAPFGPLSDAQWDQLTRSSVAQRPDGRWGFTYDPAIAVPFRTMPVGVDLWTLWDAIRAPTLVLRGAESDLLARETAAAMSARGPRASVVEFGGVGHAPPLFDADQIAPILAFLRS